MNQLLWEKSPFEDADAICNVDGSVWYMVHILYLNIYSISDINNPVESITILYLTAGSDFTEKWFGKTHEHFLKSYIKHSDFIGNLYDNKNSCMINCHSYRKLIHCVWLSDKSDPSQTTFSSLREITKKRKNIRQHLPDEHILLQHYRRVCGVYKYMQSYIVPCSELAFVYKPTFLDYLLIFSHILDYYLLMFLNRVILLLFRVFFLPLLLRNSNNLPPFYYEPCR